MDKSSKTQWMQISDLHIEPDSPAWTEFAKDYSNYLSDNPDKKPDFVLVSGDYRDIRTEGSFSTAEAFLLSMKEALKLDDNQIFMVPGNHDMAPRREDDPRTKEMRKLLPEDVIPWERVDETTAEKHRKSCEDEPSDYLDRICKISRTAEGNPNAVAWESLSDGFKEYSDMARRIVSWYDSDGRDPAEPQLRKWETSSNKAIQHFNIIHLNTAIIADGSRSHYQAIDFLKTRNAFVRASKSDYPAIVIAHNSFYDLHPQIQTYLRSLMSEAKVCCWICGDAHRFGKQIISCPIDRDGSYYSIPIYVCGKTAADHGDSYSDFGFMSYETDGESFSFQEYVWDRKKHTIKPGKNGSRDFANPSNPEKKGKLRIGYLSCSHYDTATEKYHLGHAYFIRKIDEWSKNGYVLLISSSHSNDHNRKVDTISTKEDDMKKLRTRWANCFDDKIKVYDIKDYLSEYNHFDDTEKRLHNYIGEVEEGLRTRWEWFQFLQNWYVDNKQIDPTVYDAILDLLRIGKEMEPSSEEEKKQFREEALSFAYLLFKNPTWYSSSWVVNFLRFWNSQLSHIVEESFEEETSISEVVIVESIRNHYVWDAFAFCAKLFGYPNYPRAEYFDVVLGTDDLPMKSSNKDGVVLLAGNSKLYPAKFRHKLEKMFDSRFENNQAIDQLREEYAKRLSLEQKKTMAKKRR